MNRKFNYLYILIAALLSAVPQWSYCAQPQVSLITCYAGPDIYELEGHTALRIKDEASDVAINWGLFDFDSPGFVFRFVKGETDYWVGAAPMDAFLYGYRREGRKVVEQVLDLDSLQTDNLLRLINENFRPENRIYRYNYVKDNCATRPLAIIERAIGDTIRLSAAPSALTASTPTFRRAMRNYHRNYPWYQFGIDLALGSEIDRPISERELAFAPEALAAMLDGATVADSSGRERPIVRSTNIIAEGTPGGATEGPTPAPLTPAAVCWAIFILGAAITVNDQRRRHVSRWFDTIMWASAGVAGCIVSFLVFISVHEATSPNWILLWLNPLPLIAAIFLWLKKTKKIVICYQIVNFALILTLLIVWTCGIQSLNPAFLPLMLLELLRGASYLRLEKW